MNSRLALAVLVLLACNSPPVRAGDDPFAALVRPTPPRTPEEERAGFRVPDGFEVQLFAAEPQILKPMNMAFDARGRLWVSSSTEYPYAAPADRPARDRIDVLEDTDGDGRADRATTFADGLNIPIGLYPYKDGVICWSIPYIWHLRDTDGDGKCDERIRLYGPMGFERDTHGMNNAFRRGFDGWLYACHGFNNETRVAGRDGHTVTMQSGNTYRMRLDGSRVEHFTHGQVNPFGMAFDGLFNLFTADCHSKPIYQLLRGGYYPSFGKPHDGLGFVPQMMEHSHGSTAIAGIAVYEAENFPAEYRGNAFTGNVMTSRVNRDVLEHHGSTVVAREQPDFLIADDPWFRPVDIQLGPDGALYVADFYNKIIGHYEVPLDHPERDRHRGRIWRIVYTGARHPVRRPPDLTTLPIEQLIGMLDHASLEYRMLATHRLVDDFGEKAIGPVREVFRTYDQALMRSHALWVLHRLDALEDSDLKLAAGDEHRIPRVHAMRVLSEMAEWNAGHRELALAGLRDEDAFVQRAAADALGRHPQYENVRPLLELLPIVPTEDTHLRHAVRIALRNQLRDEDAFARVQQEELGEGDARRIADVAIAIESPAAGSFLLRYARQNSVGRAGLVRYVAHAARHAPAAEAESIADLVRKRFADDLDFQMELLLSVHAGLERRGEPPGDAVRSWAGELAGRLLDSLHDDSGAWFNRPLADQTNQTNPWFLQRRRSADGEDAPFLCSLPPGGEQLTGTLRSPEFAVPEKLSFYLAGHRGFPNQPAHSRNAVRLRDAETQAVLAEAFPPRNDIAQPVEWDLRAHAGRRAVLELVDGDDGGAYAWLAAGRFEPAVVDLPAADPSTLARRGQAAALIAERLRISGLRPRLAKAVTTVGVELAMRAAATRAVGAIDGNSRLAALAPVIGAAEVADTLRSQAAAAVAGTDRAAVDAVVLEALRAAPAGMQAGMADALAGDPAGGELLLSAIERGYASPHLLVQPSVRAKLLAAKPSRAEERIEELTASLPSVDESLRTLIAGRIESYRRSNASADAGLNVFTKHCAACHKVGDKGTIVGPQLDGIGLRGLERLVEDILDPNRNVDVAFRTTTIVLDSGQAVTGLVRREEGAVLVLADNKGQEFTVPKDQIVEQVKSATSLMPTLGVPGGAGGEGVVSAEDFHDLLAFLLAQRTVASEPEGAPSLRE
ncbi:MAG TPA: PVC-type heme-binding CxxCH protein [Planctomycetaceae bacterium]|nr:PVC-type heme-binding CxxCH protein [Planctomycetaceae bacterium]